MKNTVKIPLILFACTIAAALVHAVYFYTQLPAGPLATRFDVQGAPNAYSSREVTIFIYLGIIALSALAAAMIVYLPLKSLNVPNRDYWLLPERREQARELYTKQILFFLAATNIFMIAMMNGLFLFNLGNVSVSGWFLPAVGVYWIFVILWLVSFYRSFKITR